MGQTDTPFTVILLAVMVVAVFRVIGANGAYDKDFYNIVVLPVRYFVGYPYRSAPARSGLWDDAKNVMREILYMAFNRACRIEILCFHTVDI